MTQNGHGQAPVPVFIRLYILLFVRYKYIYYLNDVTGCFLVSDDFCGYPESQQA